MRRWCYETFGDAHAIKLVSMATPEDIKANAEFIHLADELVQVRTTPEPGPGGHSHCADRARTSLQSEQAASCGGWSGFGL